MTDLLIGPGSYLGIIVFLILTGAGLPVPEEVAIVAAGVLSSNGLLNPWLALAACLFGALAGDCVMYWIGFHFGRSVVREHHWWARFIDPKREAQIEVMLEKHGLKVLFLARFLVGLRSPVYLSAGILHVPFRRFLLFDLLCATTVIGMFFGLSYWFGEAVTVWIRDLELALTVVLLLVALGAGVIFFFWRRRRRQRAATEHSSADGEPPPDTEVPEEPSDAREVEHVA